MIVVPVLVSGSDCDASAYDVQKKYRSMNPNAAAAAASG